MSPSIRKAAVVAGQLLMAAASPALADGQSAPGLMHSTGYGRTCAFYLDGKPAAPLQITGNQISWDYPDSVSIYTTNMQGHYTGTLNPLSLRKSDNAIVFGGSYQNGAVTFMTSSTQGVCQLTITWPIDAHLMTQH
jgi:hypothetical protein